MTHWIIDASNVMGARPDGWWRDRPAALVRLVREIAAWHDAVGEPTTVVLDGRPTPTGPPPATGCGVEVRYAGHSARDAADDEIVALVGGRHDVVVVTSDRGLAARVVAPGITVEGAGAFLRRLAAIGRA